MGDARLPKHSIKVLAMKSDLHVRKLKHVCYKCIRELNMFLKILCPVLSV